MIDFTGVKAITIPEGSVKKITRGSTVLWEKPIVDDNNYTVVFQETKVNSLIMGGDTYVFDYNLSRYPVEGETYVTIVNGVEYRHTAQYVDGVFTICRNANLTVDLPEEGSTLFVLALFGEYESVTLEIRLVTG